VNNFTKKNVLLVEPAFKSSRELVLKNSTLINDDINLYIACGLHYFDSNWALTYAVDRFDFSYPANNLVEKILLFETDKNIKFSAIVSYLDSSIQFVNEACHKLGLPVISDHLGKIIRNKYQVRKMLKDKGVDKDFWFRNLKSDQDLNDVIKSGINYPIIAKPTEMMASLGVVKINNDEELRHWFPLLLKVDFEGEELREKYGDIETSVLLEQFVTGLEYSVETVVINGIPTVFGITKKYTSDGLYWDELGHTAPAMDIDDEDRRSIVEYVRVTHKALAFQNTLTHTEFRMHGKRPIIMEINPRLAGDYIYLIQEKSNKISTGDFMIQAGLGIFPNKLKEIQLNLVKESWSVRFLTETKHVRIVNENFLTNSADDDVHLSNYVDVGDILLKPLEAYGNRVGAIISTTKKLYPEVKYKNNYLSEEPICILNTENSIIGVFHAQKLDLEKMSEVEKSCWSTEHASSLETIQNRFKANPDEHLVCVDLKSKIILGFFSLLKVSESEMTMLDKWENLAKMSLCSFSSRSKESDKFIMCGVSLSVLPDAPKGVGQLLIRAAILDSQVKGAALLNYSTRVPNFKNWKMANQKEDIKSYLDLVVAEKISEPILKISLRNGGHIIRVMHDYFQDDESMNFGIMVEHRKVDN